MMTSIGAKRWLITHLCKHETIGSNLTPTGCIEYYPGSSAVCDTMGDFQPSVSKSYNRMCNLWQVQLQAL